MEHKTFKITYEAIEPRKYEQGDGKIFWRPCIRRFVGGDVSELWLSTDLPGWSYESHHWVKIHPVHDAIPKLYKSRRRAIRLSERAAKKYNKEQLMIVREV